MKSKSLQHIFSLALILVAAAVFSNKSFAQEKKVKWAEWTAYHAVMSSTFHPSEEGNFEPIRTRSAELVTKAEEWLKSTPPKEFDKPQVKELLVLLVKESKELDALVKNKAGDDELKKALFNLHERFHSIVGACQNTEEHKEK